MSERANTTQLLVLDVDGLITSNPGDLQALADKIVLQLPEVFHNVSYIVQASASLGFKKDTVSMHLFFLLDMPVHPKTLKDFIRIFRRTVELINMPVDVGGSIGQTLRKM